MKKYNLLFLILATPPLESLEQLIKSVKQANSGAAIIVHLGGYANFLEVFEKLKNEPDIFIMPKQYETKRGYITHALVHLLLYANTNIRFEYAIMLPFNCLPIKNNLNGYIQKVNADIHISTPFKTYKYISLKNGIEHKWKSGKLVWESKVSKYLLRKYFNNKFYYGGNFEGIILHKKIINHLTHFYWKFELIKSNYSWMFEEVFFHTILIELSKRHKYKVESSQVCFLDWNQSKWIYNKESNLFDHQVVFGTKNRVLEIIKQNENAFFYKWVSTNPRDKDRNEVLNQLQNED